MSILVIQIPPRSRLHAGGAGATTAQPAQPDRHYVLSPDGITVQSQGVCAPSLMPPADQIVAVLDDADVAWHRVTLPKAPAARLRAALGSVLEDALLEDAASVHLALAPKASAGQPTWVATVDRVWLRSELALLEKARVFVERVVPSSWPDELPTGHFGEAGPTGSDDVAPPLALTWSHADGVVTFRLSGGLARAALPDAVTTGARFTATPGAAIAAQAWLGAPVTAMTLSQRCLQASRTLWNLRQFELARRHRGLRAFREAMRKFYSTEWRPVRYGLIALVLVQVAGLNFWAFHQRDELTARKKTMDALLIATFPQIQGVLDAPAQMQHEVQSLRLQAGKPADDDLEPMLQATAAAWPATRAPVDALRFEPGKLTLSANGWSDDEIGEFRSRLRPAGWLLEVVDGKFVVSRDRAWTGVTT